MEFEDYNDTSFYFWNGILPVFYEPFYGDTPVNETSEKTTQKIKIKRLCGYPVIYNQTECRDLNITSETLSECEYENGSWIFGFFICLLALLIFLGNALVILVICKERGMRSNYNYIKVSLAVADLLTGIFLLVSVLPNILYVRGTTESELIESIHTYSFPMDVIFGAILTLLNEASLLHLMYMSMDRFTAIMWPFHHRQQSSRTVMICLGVVWIISALFSFIPAAFTNIFGFTLQPVLFVPSLTLKSSGTPYMERQGLIFLTITYCIPFIITIISSLLTGLTIYRKLKMRLIMFGKKAISSSSDGQTTSSGIDSISTQKKRRRQEIKPEISVFLTLVIMIAAFVLLLLPSFVIQALFFNEYFDCSNYSAAYCITFYVGITNSLANVIIYSIRDKNFRKATKKVFRKRK